MNLHEKVGRPATCILASGEVYRGRLEGVDGSFNTLLSSCTCIGEEEKDHFLSSTSENNIGKPRIAARTLVRGENVVYIAFD